ncbi:thioredoxin family protein [Ancylomarina sp. YFZ004]
MNSKTILIGIILIISGSVNSFAQTGQLEKSAQIAKDENKLIFMNFSGSDWCRSCMVLKQSILNTAEFESFANEKLVLLDVDFPRKKKNRLSKEQTKYNEKLAEKYNKDGQFPTIIILDSDLNIVAKTGYKRLSPTQYIAHIKTLIEK